MLATCNIFKKSPVTGKNYTKPGADLRYVQSIRLTNILTAIISEADFSLQHFKECLPL